MVGEGLVLRLTLLLFFIITMVSAASLKHSIERTNNGSSGANTGCVRLSSDCFAGGNNFIQYLVGKCNGGECGPCKYAPLHCCVLTTGICTSATGTTWGVCVPDCDCNGC
jgi:hypothetical protein